MRSDPFSEALRMLFLILLGAAAALAVVIPFFWSVQNQEVRDVNVVMRLYKTQDGSGYYGKIEGKGLTVLLQPGTRVFLRKVQREKGDPFLELSFYPEREEDNKNKKKNGSGDDL